MPHSKDDIRALMKAVEACPTHGAKKATLFHGVRGMVAASIFEGRAAGHAVVRHTGMSDAAFREAIVAATLKEFEDTSAHFADIGDEVIATNLL